MSCWLPAVAEAPSLRCPLEPPQAHGRTPGLLPGPNSSLGLERLLLQGRPPCPLATFAGAALHPELCLPLCGGPAASFEQTQAGSHPGDAPWGLPVAATARLGARLGAGWELDARAPAGCANWG